ncbi:MAG: BrnA antitoxin family protein [Anaerolineae bacterium]|nr:BrnA antitoxin family protein [Anaerolineae bacterium]
MRENIMNKNIKTNLDRFDALTDDMIDTSDIPPLTEEFFQSAKWRIPKDKVKVLVEVEPDVAQWFKAQGKNYQQLLADALRRFAQEHRK